MNASRVALAAAMAGALALAGCGGGGRPSAHEFVRRANRICARARTRVRDVRVPPFTDPNAAERVLTRLTTGERDALSALRDLQPPKDRAAAVTTWLAVVDQMIDELDLTKDALAHGAVPEATDAVGRADALERRARHLARLLGIRDCRFPVPHPT